MIRKFEILKFPMHPLLNHKVIINGNIEVHNMSNRRMQNKRRRSTQRRDAKKQWIAYIIMLVIVVSAIIAIALASN